MSNVTLYNAMQSDMNVSSPFQMYLGKYLHTLEPCFASTPKIKHCP